MVNKEELERWKKLIEEDKEALDQINSETTFFKGIILGIVIGLCGNLIIAILYQELIIKLSFGWKILILLALIFILGVIFYFSGYTILINKKSKDIFRKQKETKEKWLEEDKKLIGIA
ncbi:Uncharacterised protein [uncultured archaeon]|nr:Uncharacterised protein [uncultured archaeon]